MVEQISMNQLHDRLPSLGKNELVLDVRSPEEYAEGHIAGSKNIPVDEIEKRVSELKGYSKIYVHCFAGGRAKRAAAVLQKAGLILVCIGDSGMKDWVAAGYPVVK